MLLLPSSRSCRRHATGRMLLALIVALVIAGCDSSGYDESGRERPALRSFVVDFRLEEATFEGPFATVTYDAPEITSRVARSGLVAAYVREEDTWTALPYTYGVESEDVPAVDFTATFGYAYERGFVEVFYELSVDDAEVWDAVPKERRVKVVIFSQEVVRRYQQRVDFRDYEAVRQRFTLND